MPTKSLDKRVSKCQSDKNSKEQVTVLFCANLEGSFKKLLMTIEIKKAGEVGGHSTPLAE